MTTALYLTLMVSILAGLVLATRYLIRAYSRYRGLRITRCPETLKPAIVEVDALHAALTSMVGLTDIRLAQCSRWPLQQECAQECLANLDVVPEEDRVNSVLMRWYNSKRCVYCGRQFEVLRWLDDKPALQSPEGKLMQWHEVPRGSLETVLKDYLPVCWNCYLVQYFRHQYPGMVVYQPYKRGFAAKSSVTDFTTQPNPVGTIPSPQTGENHSTGVLWP